MAQQPDDDDLEFRDVTDGSAPAAPPNDGDGPAADATADVSDDLEVVLAESADEPADDAVTDDAAVDPPADDDALSAGGEETDTTPVGEDEDLDEEAKSYSKAVQKRILRERRVARHARAEAQQEVLAERQQRIAAQREGLNDRKLATDMTLANLDFLIKERQTALKKAKEEGETDKEVELAGEISDLQGRKRDLEGGKKDLETRIATFEERAKVELQPKSTELPPATRDWLDRNKWISHPAFKSEAIHIRALDLQLSQKLSPSDPRYFQALDALIAREIPMLKPKIQALSRRPARTGGDRPRSSVAPGGRSAPGKTGALRTDTPNRIVLTKEDQETMREFKMDPKNPAHQKQFAREKLAAQAKR